MDKKIVLIIDDEEFFGKMVKKNLELTGEFEVMTATNGKDGIKIAEVTKPDLILLDIIMPQMDGGEVAFQIGNNEEIRDIPIVFLTATVTEEESASRGGMMGKYGMIPKTIAPDELVRRIKRQITKNREG